MIISSLALHYAKCSSTLIMIAVTMISTTSLLSYVVCPISASTTPLAANPGGGGDGGGDVITSICLETSGPQNEFTSMTLTRNSGKVTESDYSHTLSTTRHQEVQLTTANQAPALQLKFINISTTGPATVTYRSYERSVILLDCFTEVRFERKLPGNPKSPITKLLVKTRLHPDEYIVVDFSSNIIASSSSSDSSSVTMLHLPVPSDEQLSEILKNDMVSSPWCLTDLKLIVEPAVTEMWSDTLASKNVMSRFFKPRKVRILAQPTHQYIRNITATMTPLIDIPGLPEKEKWSKEQIASMRMKAERFSPNDFVGEQIPQQVPEQQQQQQALEIIEEYSIWDSIFDLFFSFQKTITIMFLFLLVSLMLHRNIVLYRDRLERFINWVQEFCANSKIVVATNTKISFIDASSLIQLNKKESHPTNFFTFESRYSQPQQQGKVDSSKSSTTTDTKQKFFGLSFPSIPITLTSGFDALGREIELNARINCKRNSDPNNHTVEKHFLKLVGYTVLLDKSQLIFNLEAAATVVLLYTLPPGEEVLGSIYDLLVNDNNNKDKTLCDQLRTADGQHMYTTTLHLASVMQTMHNGEYKQGSAVRNTRIFHQNLGPDTVVAFLDRETNAVLMRAVDLTSATENDVREPTSEYEKVDMTGFSQVLGHVLGAASKGQKTKEDQVVQKYLQEQVLARCTPGNANYCLTNGFKVVAELYAEAENLDLKIHGLRSVSEAPKPVEKTLLYAVEKHHAAWMTATRIPPPTEEVKKETAATTNSLVSAGSAAVEPSAAGGGAPSAAAASGGNRVDDDDDADTEQRTQPKVR